MPAYSLGRTREGETLKLVFEPIAFVGTGKDIEGHMTRSDLVVTRTSVDHEVFQQHFIAFDGSEREWLAVQYEYTRRE